MKNVFLEEKEHQLTLKDLKLITKDQELLFRLKRMIVLTKITPRFLLEAPLKIELTVEMNLI